MLRFGIIGTNFISEWFVAACRRSGRVVPEAVYSRSLARGEEFAARMGLARAFDDLAAMIEAVDAVYVASPNYAHADQAMQAIEAGRHVLVEKPMGISSDQVEAMFAAAERRGVIAMEALRSIHAPGHAVVRDQLSTLGEIRYARIEKLQYSSRYDRFREGETMNAFDPSLGNSALADIGVYCLQPALDLFGAPERTTGASLWLSNGFEGGGTITLDYGSFVVDTVYSKVVAGLGPSVIHGEDAAVTFDDPGELSHVERHERGGGSTVLFDVKRLAAPDNMHHELNDFADQVDAGAIDPRWRDVSIATRRVMDEQAARWTAAGGDPGSSPG